METQSKPVIGLGLFFNTPSSSPVSSPSLPKAKLEVLTNEEEEKMTLLSRQAASTSLPQISPYIIIPIWISLSGGLIIFNKWILTSKGFSFPLFLTAYHMVVAIIGTNILRYTTNLLDAANKPIPSRVWTRAIVPTAVLYAFSLVLSNIAYVHLSVPFIQMIKASTPVLLQLISFVAGLAKLDRVMGVILVTISLGCAIATSGELWYDSVGLICQAGAVIAEASRLLVMQVLLRDIKLDPLVSLYYYAPTCLLFIAAALPFVEGIKPFLAVTKLGFPILLANGLMAFALNVSSVMLISSAGSMVSTLSGVVKDIILIIVSVLVLGAVITGQQIFGYGLALVGLVAFKNKNKIEAWLERSSMNHFVSPRSFLPLFSPVMGSDEDDEAVGFLPFWVSKRPSEIDLNDESTESRWLPRRSLLLKRSVLALAAIGIFVVVILISHVDQGKVWQNTWESTSAGNTLLEREMA